MYEAFFHLESRPFPSTPRVDHYFPASTIEDAFRILSRCVERAEGPGLAIGGPGTGKSLLCELLATRFRDRFHVVKLDSAHLCTRRALLQNILFELKLPFRAMDEGDLRLSLLDFLKPGEAAREGMLLVVDEAHTLPLRLVEEIRMITNLVRDGQSRARLVLVGDAALEEHLANSKLASLNQRIAARCYIQSLTYEETIEFVRSQIASVGGEPDRLFTEDALQAVFHASDGIPRLINQVCDHALIFLSNKRGHQLSANVVEEAWADLQQLPMPMSSESQSPPPSNTVVEFGSLDDSLLGEEEVDEGTDIVEEDLTADDLLIGRAEFPDEDRGSQPDIATTREIDLTAQLGEIEQQIQQIESFDASSACQETALDTEPIDAEPPLAEQTDLADVDAGTSRPSGLNVDDPYDPFAESFAYEEPVADHYTTLETASPATRRAAPRRREYEGDSTTPSRFAPSEPTPREHDADHGDTTGLLGQALDAGRDESAQIDAERPDRLELDNEIPPPAVDETSTRPGVVRARVLRSAPPDDSDLLVVVDDQLESDSLENLPARTHRRRYRDLFTRLRES